MTLPPRAEAEAAANDLREACTLHGITLPALGLDVAGVAAGYPLVQLGSTPAATVRLLAAALRQAADADPHSEP